MNKRRESMPSIHRLSLLFLVVGASGVITMTLAPAVSGWQAITVFSSGLMLAAGGLLTSLFLSMAAALSGSAWRRLALLEGVTALVLLAVVAILWTLA
jgi:hypothetical protein